MAQRRHVISKRCPSARTFRHFAVAAKASNQSVRSTAWGQTKQQEKYPALTSTVNTEVAVVGGGIYGLSIAYQLVKAGKKVVVVDNKEVGSGQTGKTTAHVMMWNDDYYMEIESKFGKDKTRQVAMSHVAAADFIEQVIKNEKIDCEWERVDGYLFPHDGKRLTRRTLDEELEAAQRAGMPGVEIVTLPGDSSVGNIQDALKFPGCADFHPLKYLNGLAEAVVRHGGKIYENTHVSKLHNDSLETPDGLRINASEAIVLASHSPIHQNLAIHSRQEPDRTYVVGLEVPEGSVAKAQYWSTAEPYHYIRTTKYDGKEVLIVGGGDHHVGQRPDKYEDPYGSLESYARQLFPQAGKRVLQWTGMVYEPIDFVGFIGEDPFSSFLTGKVKHYIATGDSGQGMTGSAIAAMILGDLILGRPNAFAEVYSPQRVGPSVESVPEIAGQVAATARGYVDAVAPRGLKDVQGALSPVSMDRQLEPGAGMVVQEGLSKVAMYKDDDGKLHKFSAICPHLKCAVEWNPVDTTFDCVCHGSQFSKHGKCIQGPSVEDLAPIDV